MIRTFVQAFVGVGILASSVVALPEFQSLMRTIGLAGQMTAVAAFVASMSRLALPNHSTRKRGSGQMERKSTPIAQMVEQFTDDELINEYREALGLQALSQEYLATLEDEHFKRNLGSVALAYLVEQSREEPTVSSEVLPLST